MARTRQGFCRKIRFLAGTVLLLWISGVTLCWAHCAFGGCNQKTGKADARPSCHGGGQSKDSSNAPQEVCLNKQNVTVTDAHASIPELPMAVAYSQPILQQDLANFRAVPMEVRQAKTRVWIFEPEVCLGAAVRSHAPPVS